MAGSQVRFALALPHTPWIPERVESFRRLCQHLEVAVDENRGVPFVRQLMYCPEVFSRDGAEWGAYTFQERESNRVWSQKMWRWAVSTGATHLIQIQDDVEVAPGFWEKLRAMVEAVPDQIIGLEAAHPMGPELAHKGARWYRTRAWLIGPAYVFPLDPLLPCGLPRFLAWCDANPERVQAENEDTLVNRWAEEVGVDIWHPLPTIIDHDVTVPSTYNNDGHSHRRPTVTWQGYQDAMLETHSYWTPPSEPNPQRLTDPYAPVCWFCTQERGVVASHVTGARLGVKCLAQIVGAAIGRLGKQVVNEEAAST